MTQHFIAHWDDTQQTCYSLTLLEGWTWDDWMQGHMAAYRDISTVLHPVDFIVELWNTLPSGDSVRCLRFARQRPAQIRHVVYANHTGPTLQHTVQAISQVMRWKVPHFAGSLSEAKVYIRKLRAQFDGKTTPQ